MSISHMLFSVKGRITRSQFWIYTIILAVPHLILISYEEEIFSFFKRRNDDEEIGYVISYIDFLAIFVFFVWTSICISVKRWHDRDKSGWFQLILFVPVVGAIWTFIELGILDGTQGENKYGPSPKGFSQVPDVFS